MGSPEHRPETTLHLRRTFAAPPEKIFRAWTDPEELKKWWGPEGYSTPTAEVDLRVGGAYRFGMKKLPDGDLFYLAGIFREIRPREKLVYTWFWEGQRQLGDTVVTVEFHDRGGSTEIVLTQEFFPNENVRDDHVRGWSSGLDRLAKAV